MPSISAKAKDIIEDFGKQPGVTREHVDHLQEVIGASPALVEQWNAAVAADHLRRVVPSANLHAAGEYSASERTIHLRLDKLTSSMDGRYHLAEEMTFVLGHEVQHCFGSAEVSDANRQFHSQARAMARSPDAEHEYTAVVGSLLEAHRRDEAAAEISGWNALVSRIRNDDPSPALKKLYDANRRMADFIDESSDRPPTYSLKPNLTLNPDMTISPTPANIEAMGQNYFDKPKEKSRLGDLGKSDYRTYYGVHAVEQVIGYERRYAESHQDVRPRMTFDMKRLGLREELLEQEGIRLPETLTRHPYYDSSRTPSELRHFDHTQDGRVGPRQDHQYVPIAPLSAARAFDGAPFNDPTLDRYYAALLKGGSDEMDRIAREFAQSPEGRQMALWGNGLHEQHQIQERQVAQAQSRGHGR